MNTKLFEVISGDVVPPRSNNEVWITHNVSDPYFAKCLLDNGSEQLEIIHYCFNNNKWLFSKMGNKSVIEYYRYLY